MWHTSERTELVWLQRHLPWAKLLGKLEVVQLRVGQLLLLLPPLLGEDERGVRGRGVGRREERECVGGWEGKG